MNSENCGPVCAPSLGNQRAGQRSTPPRKRTPKKTKIVNAGAKARKSNIPQAKILDLSQNGFSQNGYGRCPVIENLEVRGLMFCALAADVTRLEEHHLIDHSLLVWLSEVGVPSSLPPLALMGSPNLAQAKRLLRLMTFVFLRDTTPARTWWRSASQVKARLDLRSWTPTFFHDPIFRILRKHMWMLHCRRFVLLHGLFDFQSLREQGDQWDVL